MPDIITCSKCGKETYQGRASCPHCGGWLLDHPFTPIAPDLSKVPDHASFLALHRSGAYRLQIDYNDLDLDQLMEAAGVTGLKRMTMRAAHFLDPLMSLFLGGWSTLAARAVLMTDKTGQDGDSYHTVDRDIAHHFLRKSRANAVARAMATSAGFYEGVVRSETVVVVAL